MMNIYYGPTKQTFHVQSESELLALITWLRLSELLTKVTR